MEQKLQELVSELGNSIAQLNVDLAFERITNKDLREELELTKQKLKEKEQPENEQ